MVLKDIKCDVQKTHSTLGKLLQSPTSLQQAAKSNPMLWDTSVIWWHWSQTHTGLTLKDMSKTDLYQTTAKHNNAWTVYLILWIYFVSLYFIASCDAHFPEGHQHQFSWRLFVWREPCHHLTHLGRDKMATVFQTTFSNAFSWMKMYKFWWRFHWSLFPRVQLTIYQHWFR